ncbi:hypothetical protein [Endozoicomonas sp. YOMI1]|uniref:hypothetical protein n=1 Tax=Endozoicomonas sp. YOMI1 TaxID=2828739 RepID=UPI002148A3DE|nr:hypothetical protein [Endozoicomonas sp. YOMI1]
MNNLSPTSTTPAVYVPQPKDAEQVGHAFAGGKEVKPSDIGKDHSQCPPKNAGYSFQERTIALFFGDQVTLMSKNIDASLRAPDSLIHSYYNLPKLDEVLQVAVDTLSHTLNQNWSKGDAIAMSAIAHMTLGYLCHHRNKSPSESETIEQKISELRQYVNTLQSYKKRINLITKIPALSLHKT